MNPSICINSPSSGATLTGTVTVSTTVTGGSFSKIIFKLGAEYLLADSRAPYGFHFDTSALADGTYNLIAYSVNSSSVSGSADSIVSIPVTLANGVSSAPKAPTGFVPRSVPPNPASGVVVAAVGDAWDGGVAQEDVTRLMSSWNPEQVLTLGDVYEGGSRMEFLNWLGYGTGPSSFGKFLPITNPSPGNHEYIADRESGRSGLGGYRWYYGTPPEYYSATVGGWRLYSLNSNCGVVSCAAGSAQYKWLQAQLKADQHTCSMAIHHHPRLTTGPQGDSPSFDPLWRLLAAGGLDIDLTGHDHSYQRWQALDENLSPSPTGTTAFVVGTGGHGTQTFTQRSDARRVTGSTSYGALRLRLFPDRAEYAFVSPSGGVLDSGTVACTGSGSGDLEPPTTPANLTGAISASTSVVLAWDAATDNVGVAGYQITRDGLVVAATATSPRAYTDTGRTVGQTYVYAVRAVDDVGNVSPASEPLSVVVAPDSEAPSAPPSVTATATSTTTVALSWAPATDNVGLAGYDVYRNNKKIKSVGGSVTSYTSTGLSASTVYEYAVSAKDAAGNISLPAVASVTTLSPPDTAKPSVPTDVGATPLAGDRVQVRWSASSDNVAVASYEVLRDGVSVGTTASSVTTYLDAGLQQSTTYRYTVRARDAAGNASAVSSALTVTTPITPTATLESATVDTTGSLNVVAAVQTHGVAGAWRLEIDPAAGVVGPAGSFDAAPESTVISGAIPSLPLGTYTVTLVVEPGNTVLSSGVVVGGSAPAALGRARLVGKNAKVGSVIRCAAPALSGYPTPTVAYAWFAGQKAIRGARKPAIRISQGLVKARLSCHLTVANTLGSARLRTKAVLVRR